MDSLTAADGSKGVLRPRINGELMASHVGQHVCLLGNATDVDSSGTVFKLQTGDNVTITVHLQEPNDGYISGIVEVFGKVTSKVSILCDNLIVFPAEYTKTMDLTQYNEAVHFLHKTQHYSTS